MWERFVVGEFCCGRFVVREIQIVPLFSTVGRGEFVLGYGCTMGRGGVIGTYHAAHGESEAQQRLVDLLSANSLLEEGERLD